jgi:hypothetical protein
MLASQANIGMYANITNMDSLGIYMGKLSYFTNLKCSAIKGDDFPKIKTMIPGFGRGIDRSIHG